MLDNYFNYVDVSEFRHWLEWADNFLIATHKSPDGDAVGSSLAMALYLESKGKNVTVVLPDNAPEFLTWMTGYDKVLIYERDSEQVDALAATFDVICCLDFNSPDRVGKMSQLLKDSRSKMIMIDHHIDPSPFCEQILSRPEASSTSELVFHLICALGDWGAVTRQMAECICAGMITDTGGFTYNSNSSQFFFIISQLIEKNIDKDLIFRRIFHNYSESRLRLTGLVLSQKMVIFKECHAALITLTRDEQNELHCKKGDTEGIVNMPLQMSEIRLSAFLREDTAKDIIRISLRSVDEVPCNRFCEEFFGGGGHKNAAGGEFSGTLEECVGIFSAGLEKWRHSSDPAIRQLFR